MGWQETGKIDFALGGAATVICLNPDARQYGFAPGMSDHSGAENRDRLDQAGHGRRVWRGRACASTTLEPLDPVDVMPGRIGPRQASKPGGTLFLVLGRGLQAL